jgi:hypothetical protein
VGAQGLGGAPGTDRQKVLQHTGSDPIRQEGGILRPQLVEFGGRAALRRPDDTGLRRVAAGTAEAGQPNRDRAEHGGNPAGPVIFQRARRAAGPAARPPGGMVPALRRDHRLLHPGQKLLALRVRQTEIRQIAQIPGLTSHPLGGAWWW